MQNATKKIARIGFNSNVRLGLGLGLGSNRIGDFGWDRMGKTAAADSTRETGEERRDRQWPTPLKHNSALARFLLVLVMVLAGQLCWL